MQITAELLPLEFIESTNPDGLHDEYDLVECFTSFGLFRLCADRERTHFYGYMIEDFDENAWRDGLLSAENNDCLWYGDTYQEVYDKANKKLELFFGNMLDRHCKILKVEK